MGGDWTGINVMTKIPDNQQQLKDDVTELKVTMKQVVQPSLLRIESTIERMSFVSKTEYAEDRSKLEAELVELRQFKQDAKAAIKFFNTLNSRWTQVLVGALLAAAAFAISNQIVKVV
jgi:hypothetical protein